MAPTFSQEVLIHATAAAVWRALVDPIELARWFAVAARLVPGVGGSISLTWDDQREGSAPLTVWEPERRLQWIEHGDGRLVIVEVGLEPRAACTTVRVTQSTFGGGAPSMLEERAACTAWAYFLQHLKWYLEHHAGVDRRLAAWRDVVAFSPREAFARLTGAAGLSSDEIFDGVAAGDPYATTTAFGEPISGSVVALSRETTQIGITLSELGEAILLIEIESSDEGTRAGFWLSTYRLDSQRVALVRNHYGRLYRNALGVEGWG